MHINAVKTALSSPNTLSTTGGDIISGAVGGYSTEGSEGAVYGAVAGGFVSLLNLPPSVSGSLSNLTGQTLGITTKYLSGESKTFEWYEINLLEEGVSGVANKTSSVFKALPSTQPTLGRVLAGETAAGVYVGTAGGVSPEYTAGELVDKIDKTIFTEGE